MHYGSLSQTYSSVVVFLVKYKKIYTDVVCLCLPVESSYKQYQTDNLDGKSNVQAPPQTCNYYNKHTRVILLGTKNHYDTRRKCIYQKKTCFTTQCLEKNIHLCCWLKPPIFVPLKTERNTLQYVHLMLWWRHKSVVAGHKSLLHWVSS